MTPAFIDSHAHIDAEEFDADRDAVIERAAANGVSKIIVVGAAGDLATAERTVALSESRDGLWATVGVHPHDAAKLQPDWWGPLEELARRPRVVAIGETGLDYHYDLSPRDVQRSRFAEFIDLAHEVNKPVVCHIRDAHEDAQRILDRGNAAAVGVIIHCFTGTPADARRYAERGYYVSFSGIVSFKSANSLRDAVAEVPLDRLLVETDCPYLAPVPMRGKRNEPAFLVHTAQVVADAAGVSLAELSRATVDNTHRAFRFDATPGTFTS